MFGLLKKYDVHLSPEVVGRITLNAKPLPNQEVIRSLTYTHHKETIEKTFTDNNGNFSFPERNTTSRKPGSMFDESNVRQIILVERNGDKFLLWFANTIGIKPAKAIHKRLSSLNCDLNDSEISLEFSSIEHPQTSHFVHSICRW